MFKTSAFVQHLREENQKVQYCGVNTHHKNSIAERSMCTVSEMAMIMILHASIHWKDGIEGVLWSMVVDYSEYIYNYLTNEKGIFPADMFTIFMIPRQKLKDIHVFWYHVYVLNQVL